MEGPPAGAMRRCAGRRPVVAPTNIFTLVLFFVLFIRQTPLPPFPVYCRGKLNCFNETTPRPQPRWQQSCDVCGNANSCCSNLSNCPEVSKDGYNFTEYIHQGRVFRFLSRTDGNVSLECNADILIWPLRSHMDHFETIPSLNSPKATHRCRGLRTT